MTQPQIGLFGEAQFVVGEEHTSIALGSGSVPVLGTPALVALMERAAVGAVASSLPPGTTSVGISLEIRHQAPTPTGVRVRAEATLAQIDGRTLTFHVTAYDETEQIGDGIHRRMLVEQDRFLRRVAAKRHPHR